MTRRFAVGHHAQRRRAADRRAAVGNRPRAPCRGRDRVDRRRPPALRALPHGRRRRRAAARDARRDADVAAGGRVDLRVRRHHVVDLGADRRAPRRSQRRDERAAVALLLRAGARPRVRDPDEPPARGRGGGGRACSGAGGDRRARARARGDRPRRRRVPRQVRERADRSRAPARRRDARPRHRAEGRLPEEGLAAAARAAAGARRVLRAESAVRDRRNARRSGLLAGRGRFDRVVPRRRPRDGAAFASGAPSSGPNGYARSVMRSITTTRHVPALGKATRAR